MQSDPAVLQVAKTAVVTEPSIQNLLEIGGGTIESHQKNITKDLTKQMCG